MVQYYLYFKAFHIVGFVSWFAGLFYLGRIFVYHAEAEAREEPMRMELKKQFGLMSERVYGIIMNPAMMITWACGLSMLAINPGILGQNWIKVKLVLLVLLTAFHLYCGGIVKKQLTGHSPHSSYQFRLLNELPTLFLLAIVLLAVVKDVLNFAYLFLGILAFGLILFTLVKAYKKYREKKTKL